MSGLSLTESELKTLIVSAAAALANGLANGMLDRDEIVDRIMRLQSFAVRLPQAPPAAKKDEDEDNLNRERNKDLN
jgi:hypothetical protein